jgi:pyruvate/2-oxoglutarate dehydrogenase complex dihydrolipoamide dehydrogenase (E3) component
MRERGIDLYMSQASFISPHEIAVSDQTLWADQILIAAGTETSVPSVEGLTEVGFITNVEAVSLPKLPQRLAIVGGGPLGLEFAQIFSRFGVTVTVLESLPDILSTEDREVADKLCELLAEEGVSFRTGVKLQQAQSQNGAKRLILQDADEQKEELVVDEILLAAGRRPALAPLNLKAAGVETNEQGIVVDKTLRTNVPHIWAAGDVIGGYKFTSVASAQGVRVARNAFAEKPEPFDDSLIPWAVYTHPGLAHIGKTEKQLQEAGTNYEVVQTSLEEVARAVAMNKSTGLVKLLVAEDGQILGGHILAPHAGDLIALIVLAMKYGLTADSVGSTILPYPTLVEAITKTMRKV